MITPRLLPVLAADALSFYLTTPLFPSHTNPHRSRVLISGGIYGEDVQVKIASIDEYLCKNGERAQRMVVVVV